MRSDEGPSGILSNAGHEESCANPPGPSGKAKHSHETDSEMRPIANQYCEGKVKSTPTRRVKEILKPCAYKRSELPCAVMACLLHNEPTSYRHRQG